MILPSVPMMDDPVTNAQRFSNILDAAGDAIISVDQDQRIIAFNRAASQIFGYSAHEVLGLGLGILLPENVIEVHRSHVLSYGREQGSTRRMGARRELSGRRKDGLCFPVEVSISKTFDGAEGPVFTAILRDITERRAAESERVRMLDKLKIAVAEADRNHAQLEAVFQSMEDGIAVLNEQGDVVLANDALARMNGYARREDMRRNLVDFAQVYELCELDGSLVPLDRWPASRCLRGETLQGWVLNARRKDSGHLGVFRFSGMPIHDAEGRQILAVVLMRDITEYKQVESELRQLNQQLEKRVRERTAELEAANRELEAFSYSVSHDLRAPLRAIDGFSQALLEDYSGTIDEIGKGYLKRVRAGSVRMANLIDDILQLSRVTRAELQRQFVNLSALADSILAELRSAEPDRRVDVAIEPGLMVEGDARLLRIALVNLLANAWKFTGLNPAARIEIGAMADVIEPTIYVRDNGVGFDMAYVAKLFGAFQRLHTETEFPGTGIGLAIVQRIVHRHGGRVWAESVVNQGSTFFFSLPKSHVTTDEGNVK